MGWPMDREVKLGLWTAGVVAAVVILVVAVVANGITPRSDVVEPARAEPVEIPPSPQTDTEPHAWFVVDMTGTECFTPSKSGEASPAAWIKSERDNGETPETKENRDSGGNLESVEISVPVSDGLQTRVWTYYRSKEACEQAIQKRNHIPDEYK